MENFIGSRYYKEKGSIFFDNRAKYGREADTIIFWYAITPTGKISKWHATLRINSERNVSSEHKQQHVDSYVFPKMPKGYTWSKPLLYSGKM
jgi:hypothetical protein